MFDRKCFGDDIICGRKLLKALKRVLVKSILKVITPVYIYYKLINYSLLSLYKYLQFSTIFYYYASYSFINISKIPVKYVKYF